MNLNKGDSHNVFNSQLSFKILFRIIYDYIKLFIKSISVIQRRKKLFLFDDSDFDFYFSTWSKSIQKCEPLGYDLNEDVTPEMILKHIPNAVIDIVNDCPGETVDGVAVTDVIDGPVSSSEPPETEKDPRVESRVPPLLFVSLPNASCAYGVIT